MSTRALSAVAELRTQRRTCASLSWQARVRISRSPAPKRRTLIRGCEQRNDNNKYHYYYYYYYYYYHNI